MLCDLPFPSNLSKNAFEEWMGTDSNLTTDAPLTEADICNDILQHDNADLSSFDEETEDEITLYSQKEVIDALATVRRLVQCRGTKNNFDDNRKYEKFVKDLGTRL